ncbi:MAG: hypothetical protein K2I36_03225 [Ureaplasma sp.]|nr:hypothetical protein [Ureaplasma sp.]
MTKMISDEIQSIYDDATKKIDIIFLSSQTIDLLHKDENFQKILTNVIGIVNFITLHYDLDTKNISHYTQAYHQITNKNLKFDDNENSYQNLTDIKDTINYLNVYILNTLGKSFDQIELELKNNTKDNNSNIDSSNNDNEQLSSEETFQSNDDHFNQKLSDEELLRRSGVTMHDVADQLIQNQSMIYLQRNIRKGKVFIYDSKPKIIPIIKYLAFILFIIIFILSIANYAILLSQNGKLQLQDQNGDLKAFGFVSPVPFQQILLGCIIGIICWSIIRNIKNDNNKYFLSWGWMLFYTLFLLVINLVSQESQFLLFRYDSFLSQLKTIDSNLSYLETWKSFIQIFQILEYISFGIYVLLLVCVVIGSIYNPKKDVNRINELLNQYANEIRNGQIDTSELSTAGGFGSQLF